MAALIVIGWEMACGRAPAPSRSLSHPTS